MRTVLVVEDTQDIRELFRLVLNQAGYRCLTAGNGEEALQVLGAHHVDVVVLDWLMPVMTGMAVLRRIRSDPDNASTPVIFVTAKALEEDRTLAMEAGASAYLSKPLSTRELILEVGRLAK